ncbi:MAG TPA: OPT/YSL family transporter [Methanocella sp.]|nr:OPT/YSL family transporter [Methanocella sp.]
MALRIDDRIPAIALGVVFSALNAFIYMYLALKTGMATGLDILLLFAAFFVFAVSGSARPRAFLYMMAIMAMSIAAVLAYTDSLGAILISGEALPAPGAAMAALISISLLLGMLASSFFAGYFLRSGFAWPGPKVSVAIISLLSDNKGPGFRASATRMGAAAIMGGIVSGLKGIGLLPETIGTTVAGLSLSPFLAGIGMIIGIQGCLQIALGALGSLLILYLEEGGSAGYITHMRSPWIFSTATAMMVAGAGISLYVVLKPALISIYYRKIRLPDKAGTSESIGVGKLITFLSSHDSIISGVLLLTTTALAAALIHSLVGVSLPLFCICIPLALLLMVIETRGRAETAMSIGIAAFVIVLLTGMAFGNTMSLLLFQGFVLATTFGFASTLSLYKVAEHFGINRRGLRYMLVIGAVTGGIICTPCVDLLNRLYGIGSDVLPAPYSVMWLEMARSAVTKVVSPSIDLRFIIIGTVLALIAHRLKVSAVSMALGLLLPVSASAAILIGGAIAWIAEKKSLLKDDHGITASGLVAGDILVGLLFAVKELL